MTEPGRVEVTIPVTMSLGWNGLQTASSCILVKLQEFVPSGMPRTRPNKSLIDSTLLEMDLDYILKVKASVACLTREAYQEMDQMALDVLNSLDNMANLDITKDTQASNRAKPAQSKLLVDDIATLSEDFKRLHALLSFLSSLSFPDDKRQFNLIIGPNPLFTLPPGDAGAQALVRLARWKELLKWLTADSQTLGGSSLVPQDTTETSEPELLDQACRKSVSTVVETIFNEFRQLNCVKNATHEIRLLLPNYLDTSCLDGQLILDMFISCCPGGTLIWQDAQCGYFPIKNIAKVCICDSIKRAMNHRKKLRIAVDSRGLFDITEKHPAIKLPRDSFDGASLSELLRKEVFRPIDVQDHLRKTAEEKVGSPAKAQIALGLSRCLMDFFDKGLELASHSWAADNVHFRDGPINEKGETQRLLYISLRPNLSEDADLDMHKMFNSGSPVVLSFAKLLLEVLSGKPLDIQIHPDDGDNLLSWLNLDGVVEKMLQDPELNPFVSKYLEVVQGCLNLWTTLQTFENRTDLSATRRFIRKAIYQTIVRKLELIVSSRQKKQKPSDSFVEPPIKRLTSLRSKSKEASCYALITTRPSTSKNCHSTVLQPADDETTGAENADDSTSPTDDLAGRYGRLALYDEQAENSLSDRGTAEGYLNDLDDSIKKYIKPLGSWPAKSRNLVRVAIVDSGLDMTDPKILAKKDQIGGWRNWASDQHDDCTDTCGHGTHVTRLILSVAPAVEVYIAKVSNTKKFDSNVAGQIVQAIEWATGVWKVDIISLSLGMDSEEEKLKRALDDVLDPPRSSHKNTIVMAAAANWGGNRRIAFPARYENIICIHSTDGLGNPSKNTPTAQEGKDFAVLGMSIKSSVKGKDKKRRDAYISGTSYATAIGAGIAANVLEFTRRDPKLGDFQKESLCSSSGMARVFSRMCAEEKRQGYRYVMPRELFDGRSEAEIWRDIRTALKA